MALAEPAAPTGGLVDGLVDSYGEAVRPDGVALGLVTAPAAAPKGAAPDGRASPSSPEKPP